MRSATEIKFRLRQETANLYLLWRKPQFRGVLPERLNLPESQDVVAALRNTDYARNVEELADRVLQHRFPIFGTEIQTGAEIRWRRDYRHDKESGTNYYKRVRYLDFDAVGDHKYVWEINRHQHLVLLAQAYLFTARQEFLTEISKEIYSWLSQNPFQRGMNWASALEVAFRTLSWIWVYHLVGEQFDSDLQVAFGSSLYQHGLHLANNLSVYFSPNTHLLGEAVALFALATLFPQFPGATEWAEQSKAIVLGQLDFQVNEDGSHFEQSTYYHVYAVDFFLLFYLLSERLKIVETALSKMAVYLSWVLGPARQISFFGDDDGGRLFHPYGERNRFGKATLATCGLLLKRPEWALSKDDVAEQAAWWLGASALEGGNKETDTSLGSRIFQNSGAVFLEAGTFWLQADFGPFGFGGAGHSHSDTLSFIFLLAGESVLVDPGTFTYSSDIANRNWFRGSGAHNTVRVDNLEQADAVSPFRWSEKPRVGGVEIRETPEGWLADGWCEYRGVRHRRSLLLNEHRLLVLDELTGGAGVHVCEQVWQLGPKANEISLATSAPSETRESLFSPAYGRKLEGRCLVATERGDFPIYMSMMVSKTSLGTVNIEEAKRTFAAIS